MKDEKLTLVGLRKQVAQRAGISESAAERFLNQLFSSVTSGLKQDKQVRISGLGTFRVQYNEPRKSVNVQTGEPIILEGYNKVVFQPESMLKERVNLPMALAQEKAEAAAPVSGAAPKDGSLDPLQKLGEQADEIKDILAELGTAPEEEKPVPAKKPRRAKQQEPEKDAENVKVEEEKDEPKAEETKEMTPEPEMVAEPEPEKVAEPEPEKVAEPEPEKVAEPEPEKVAEPEPEKVAESEPEKVAEPEPAKEEAASPIILGPSHQDSEHAESEKNKKRPFRPWLVASITMLIFCILLVCAYFLLRHQLTEWANGLLSKDKQTEQVQPAVEQNDGDAVEISDTENHAAANPVAVQKDASQLPAREYKEFITTERLTSGSRLAWLSRKYYGVPDFWVYIYEANADKIADPNVIRVGTKVRVPKMPPELVDPKSEAALNQAHELHKQILGK